MTQNHTFTKQEQKKGGQARTLRKKLSQRTTCTTTCPLFLRCPFASAGLRHNTCYLNSNKFPELKKNLQRLTQGDEEGFFKVMESILINMLRIDEAEDNTNIRSKKTIIDGMKQLHEMKYGNKTRVEHSGSIGLEAYRKFLHQEENNTT